MADAKLIDISEIGSALALTDLVYLLDDPAGVPLDKSVYVSRLMLDQAFIRGLVVTKNSGGNTLDISAGYCFDPATNKVIYYAGGTGVSAGTLGASQWNQVYLSESGGVSTVTVTNNADPPSSTYFGTARKDGSNRRWIGEFLTNGSSAIYDFQRLEVVGGQTITAWKTATNTTPFRALSAGSSTTYGSITSLSGSVPKYAATEFLANLAMGYGTTGGASMNASLSIDGTNNTTRIEGYIPNTTDFTQQILWCPLETSNPGFYYKITVRSPGVGPTLYVDANAYRVCR